MRANTEQPWLAPHHRSLICLPCLPQPQAKSLTGKSVPHSTRQLGPKQQPWLASVSAGLQRAASIPKNPVPGAHQEQQPGKLVMPSTRWVPAGEGSATRMQGGQVWYRDAVGQELPVCLSPSVGWLGNTAHDTRVPPPPRQCSAHWAGTGLRWVSAACTEAACSRSGVHQHDSLITAVLRRPMSTRCDVFVGGCMQPGHFLPPAQGGEGQG